MLLRQVGELEHSLRFSDNLHFRAENVKADGPRDRQSECSQSELHGRAGLPTVPWEVIRPRGHSCRAPRL